MDQNTSNQNLLYGVIGLLLGIVLTILVVNNQMYGMMRMMGMGGAASSMMQMHDNDRTGMNMSMNAMNDELADKTGDDFDKAFITQMVTHHQGAIIMASEAKQKANHQEIKDLANAIITAQQKEIDEMKGWYKNWYGTDLEVEDVNSDAPMMH